MSTGNDSGQAWKRDEAGIAKNYLLYKIDRERERERHREREQYSKNRLL